MLKLIPVPAFTDNYLWLLHDGKRALVVDPGDAAPIMRILQSEGLELESILVTHHHADHTGGVDALRNATGAVVYGPASEKIPGPYKPLREDDVVHAMGIDFTVVDVPGHTAGHIAFYTEHCVSIDDAPGVPLLFCGDTLFSGGCGRLFEGTPAQMLASLDKLVALPASTQVCCAHEYTLNNLHFALAVEPENIALLDYNRHCLELRASGKPTVPALLATELQINPFLRTRKAAVKAAALRFDASANDDVAVFAAIRQWKNKFK